MSWWIPVILGIFVVTGVGYTFWMMHRDQLVAETRIKSLDFKLRDFQKTLNEYQTAVDEKNYLQDKRDFVNSISQNQKQWIDFFDDLKAKIPKDVWLTRLDGSRTGQYDIEGNAFSFGSIGFFMIQFKSIPAITTVNLDSAASLGGGGGNTQAVAVSKMFKLTGDMKLAAEAGDGANATGTQAIRPPVQ